MLLLLLLLRAFLLLAVGCLMRRPLTAVVHRMRERYLRKCCLTLRWMMKALHAP